MTLSEGRFPTLGPAPSPRQVYAAEEEQDLSFIAVMDKIQARSDRFR